MCRCLLYVLTIVLSFSVTALADNAPHSRQAFLGAGASSTNAETLPIKWSPSENVSWLATLPGHGPSSPVV